MKRAKASVVWELVDADGAQRLVVDVDAPLRPFGADPTPPHGVALPAMAQGESALCDDTLGDLELELELEPPAAPSPSAPSTTLSTTDAILKALRARSRRD